MLCCRLVEKLTTEDMISEVKKCNVLWDSTLDAYQNKTLRTRAWRNIMTELIPQLPTMTSSEQAEIENAIRKRWKSIRTCYSRELLRQKTEDPSLRGRKQYQYFDQLRFLDIVSKSDATTGEESVSQDPSPKTVNVSVPVQRPVKKTTTNVKRKADEINVGEKRIKKQAVRYRNLELENEADRMFLLALVPDLQKVSPGKKLQLKSDILNSILRAQHQDPLSGTQLYIAETDLNVSHSSTGGKLYNNIMFHKNLKELQQESHDGDVYVSPNNLGMEFIKMEAAESLSSLDDRVSLVGSEDCDDMFLA